MDLELLGDEQALINPDWLYDIEGLGRGRIDISIASNGQWFHEGAPIQRESLVRLLEASLLFIDGRHYLRAPEQLLSITVEDCPFQVVDFTVTDADTPQQAIMVVTSTGIQREAGVDHPISLLPIPLLLPSSTGSEDAQPDSTNESPETATPVVHIRDGMQGRFSRAAYYRLVDCAETDTETGVPVVVSGGCRFPLSV